MSRHGGRESCPLDCKVYVGELGNNGTRHEIEDAFGYYGPLKEVWVARNPPGFAFVMFQDPRDARDAVRAMDGKMLCGRRIRVELSTGKSRHDKERNGGRGSGGGYNGGSPSPRSYPRRDHPRNARRDDMDDYKRKRYSRSRSRSATPVRRVGGGGGGGRASDGYFREGGGRPRTPPSRSRSPASHSRN